MNNKKASQENNHKENLACSKEDMKSCISRKDSKPVSMSLADELNGILIESIDNDNDFSLISVSDTSDASDKIIKEVSNDPRSTKQILLEELITQDDEIPSKLLNRIKVSVKNGESKSLGLFETKDCSELSEHEEINKKRDLKNIHYADTNLLVKVFEKSPNASKILTKIYAKDYTKDSDKYQAQICKLQLVERNIRKNSSTTLYY